MRPLRIIFAGSGEFGVPTLRRLIDANHDFVQVVSQPDRPSGRGRKQTPTPISRLAIERELPLVTSDDINIVELPEADVLIVLAFGQKLSAEVVARPGLGAINLHGSRLPKYRGAAPVNWAVINGERVTGNSVIRLAQRMDAGAILAQSELQIGETETAGELHDRLAIDGVELIERVLEQLADGTARAIDQPDALATRAPKLSRQQTRIDWNRSPAAIANQIRGMYPWPGCHVRLIAPDGREACRLTLVRARPAALADAPPGTITSESTVSPGVEILEVQPEGKRPMRLAAFRNGHRWEPDMRLESVIPRS